MLSKYQVISVVCGIGAMVLLLLSWRGTVAWYLVLIPIFIFIVCAIYGASVMSANFFIESKCKAQQPTDAISVTFDDGPLADHTEKILDILAEYKVKAVFFCIGKNIAANPALAKRIIEEGHLIANHSYHHSPMFSLQSTTKIVNELLQTEKEIEKITGYKSKWFRPPYGVLNPMVAKAIRKCGYQSIGWSIRSFDTKNQTADELFQRTTKSLRGGDIVLFHDNGKQTDEVLPRFFEYAKNCGLKIERLDNLIGENYI